MSIEFNNDQIYALYDIENWWRKSNDQVYELSGAAGTGKAQPCDTVIPTPNGYKLLGEIQVNDKVFNRYGLPVDVLGVYDQGELNAYRVNLSDGRSTICNDEHLWGYYDEKGDFQIDTLKEMMTHEDITRLSIPITKAINYIDSDISDDFYDIGKSCDHKVIDNYIDTSNQRRKWTILQGITDEIGNVINCDHTRGISYITDDYNLVRSIKTILNSLGILYKMVERKKCNHNDDSTETVEEVYYEIILSLNNDNKMNFFRNSTKKYLLDNIDLSGNIVDRVHINSIVDMECKMPMRCIYVNDPEHLYLTNDYIVTHNTTLIRYAIDKLGIDLSEVAFIAYMGKAALQMARNGLPAQTIHSFIYTYEKVVDTDEDGKILLTESGKPKTKFVFTLKDHLPKKCQLIVLDEGSMVNGEIGKDILSFGIPVIVLGDLNQLPPVFGKPFFLNNPNYILTKVMRQAENNPIVWLAHNVLNNETLKYGVYGKSSVIRKSDLSEFMLNQSDIVLTCTNKLRYEINTLFRENIKNIRKLDIPNVGEKIICRKNNWSKSIDKSIFLTNGMSGTVDYLDIESFNGKGLKIDFKPDFINKKFKNLTIDYKRLFATPNTNLDNDAFDFTREKFEFAYAITTHLSQGSQYGNVIFLNEKNTFDADTYRRLQYTAITRAQQTITIVI